MGQSRSSEGEEMTSTSSLRRSPQRPSIWARPQRRGRVRRGAGEGGYALVLALVVMTALTILGVSSVASSNVDLKISRNLRHLEQARYASIAGNEHGRRMFIDGNVPATSDVSYFGTDDIANPSNWYITQADANDLVVGTDRKGSYRVNVIWVTCGGPPAGYSLDKFHSSFFDLRSEGSLTDLSDVSISAASVTTMSTLRRVMNGPCYMR